MRLQLQQRATSLLDAIISFILERPRLSSLALQVLNRMPRQKAWLKQQRLIASTRAASATQTSVCSTATGLTSYAEKLYVELQAVFAKNNDRRL